MGKSYCTFLITPELRDQFASVAHANERTVSAELRHLMRLAIERERKSSPQTDAPAAGGRAKA